MPTDSRTPDTGLPDTGLPDTELADTEPSNAEPSDAERDKAAGCYHQGNPAGSAPNRAETSLTDAAAARQNDARDHR